MPPHSPLGSKQCYKVEAAEGRERCREEQHRTCRKTQEAAGIEDSGGLGETQRQSAFVSTKTAANLEGNG